MGSQQDLVDATNFMEKNKVVPNVSHVLDNLESAEQGFTLLKQGSQTGKVVMRLWDNAGKVKL
jgi:D-arabinose 1-dehydrogenase-like Zn-dependent alcohol dehydrogenase